MVNFLFDQQDIREELLKWMRDLFIEL
jgi:hypothetical protein